MVIRTLSIGAAAAMLALAGCSHGHDHRGPAAGGVKAASDRVHDEATDTVVAHARTYLAAREKEPGKLAPKGAMEAYDRALETLIDAAAARVVAARVEALAEEYGSDPGRVARVKTAAALVKRAAQVASSQAKETLRSADDRILQNDTLVLRALLRALKADVLALEGETE